MAHDAERQASSVLKAGPTTPRLRPRTIFGNYWFIRRNTLNEELLRDKLEGGDKERSNAVQETLDWLEGKQLAGQATNEMILFSRASATRARCLEHALENLHGLLL